MSALGCTGTRGVALSDLFSKLQATLPTFHSLFHFIMPLHLATSLCRINMSQRPDHLRPATKGKRERRCRHDKSTCRRNHPSEAVPTVLLHHRPTYLAHRECCACTGFVTVGWFEAISSNRPKEAIQMSSLPFAAHIPTLFLLFLRPRTTRIYCRTAPTSASKKQRKTTTTITTTTTTPTHHTPSSARAA